MIGTLRRELLDRILVVDQRHLRRILTSYLHHFNAARPHRTLGQRTPAQTKTQPPLMIKLLTIRFGAKRSLMGSSVSITSQHDRSEHRRPAGQG
jgi:hypothetical protein